MCDFIFTHVWFLGTFFQHRWSETRVCICLCVFECFPFFYPHAVCFHHVLEVTSWQRSPVSSVLLTLGASPLPHLSNPDTVPPGGQPARIRSLSISFIWLTCLSDISPRDSWKRKEQLSLRTTILWALFVQAFGFVPFIKHKTSLFIRRHHQQRIYQWNVQRCWDSCVYNLHLKTSMRLKIALLERLVFDIFIHTSC